MADYETLLQSPAKPIGVWGGGWIGTPSSIKLIHEIGPTGFIMCSGCDIPFNAMLEDVEAMYRAVEDAAGKKYSSDRFLASLNIPKAPALPSMAEGSLF